MAALESAERSANVFAELTAATVADMLRRVPAQRRIEVDATHIGTPDIANPARAGHKKAVPTAYGLLVHEAAHAAHSLWTTPAGTPPVVAAVADLLEESRAEHRQRSRRRGDRRWLRHTVTTLLDPVDDPGHAARIAGLLAPRRRHRRGQPRDHPDRKPRHRQR